MIAAPAAWTAAPAPQAKPGGGAPRVVDFKTADGWTLAADFRPPKRGRPTLVMAHGYAASRAEWGAFAVELSSRGWGTLALDLRGHGESIQGPRGPSAFAVVDADGAWPGAAADLEAAVDFLGRQGISQGKVCLAGASLGANLVAKVAAQRRKLRCATLLSAGRDYRGVRLEEEKLGPPTLIAASPTDGYAYQTLVGFRARQTSHRLLEAAKGHGVQMLEDKDFKRRLIDWLETQRR